MRGGSVRLAFTMGRKDGPLTLDLLFSLEAGLQHPEFLCEPAKPSQHVGSPLPAQRLCASDQQQLAGHGGRTRLYAVSRLSAIWLPSTVRGRGAPLGFCLVARAQPEDSEDKEANHHDGYDEHPDKSPEQPREVGRFHACFEREEHGNEIAHAGAGCNGHTLATRNRALAFLDCRSSRWCRTLHALLRGSGRLSPHVFRQALAARLAIPLLKCFGRDFSLNQELRELPALGLTLKGHRVSRRN